MPLRILFCGTPAFAVPSLNHLITQPDFEVITVVTQPDRPRGRGQQIAVSPVKEAALAAGIPVYQPEKVKSDGSYAHFQRLAPDAVVIIAYGQIISQRLIDIPRLGWINLHGSLLPKYRGAAPINWAIVNGETRTGLTTMLIDAGMDTGAMLLKHETAIGPDETAPELAARLSEAGGPLIAESLRKLDKKEITPMPQNNSQATLAPLLKKEDGRIDWSLGAQKIYDRMRGLQPWPGAFTTFRGQNCQIGAMLSAPVPDELSQAEIAALPGTIVVRGSSLEVLCANATRLLLQFVQLEGRKRVTAGEFANGARLAPGDKFGN